MRTISIITVGRSDYGIYLPILRHLQQDPETNVDLIVGGAHLLPQHGMTVQEIEKDGFVIRDTVETPAGLNSPQEISESIGYSLAGFAKAYGRKKPDLLLALGDRIEMHAAVTAALLFKIPVAHIHGGELSMGAIDDSLRHSITKMSHLHFVATQEYRQRVLQLGEEPWRVTVSGAPSLDNLRHITLLTAQELEKKFCLSLNKPILLVTYHPVTLEYEKTESQIDELLAALDKTEMTLIFTQPNADTHRNQIAEKIGRYVTKRSNAYLVDNLGTQAYFSLMNLATAMVGNSSSGLIEAPSFKLPVVNIGTRQEGRCRAHNVIDTGNSRNEITAALRQAIQPEFRITLKDLVNPFGNGFAAEIICNRLKNVTLGETLIRKRFQDLNKYTESI